MIDVFAQSGHPVFRGISAFSRGTLKRKQGRNTINFAADSENIQLIMRTIYSKKSAQYLRSSVEVVCRPFWKHARSGIYWSEYVHSEENEELSQQLDPPEVGSLARSSPRTQ